jgi:hypothetical protein
VPLGDKVADGPVLSILNETESLADPPTLWAWQLELAPAVSFTKFWTPHPESMTTEDWASVTLQVTVTFEVYHPFEPEVPLTTLVMAGGVVSEGAAGATVTLIVTSAS